jgi:hypothetical protein
VAAADLLVATAAALTLGQRWNQVPDPVQPEIQISQDQYGVYLRLVNHNDHWGIKATQVVITLTGGPGYPIRTYGPDDVETIDAKPGPAIHCCSLPVIPPHGQYTFTFFPTKRPVSGARISLRDPEPWIRM